MQKHEFKVSKTARYFSLGALNADTKEIWFVLHGYAQTAADFLESLKPLQQENTYLVAPEGLSRFYWKDFTTTPVASWMTKTDREVDIMDNLEYLNNLYLQLTKDLDLDKVKINFLGFSQGVATLSRWLFSGVVKSDANYFYAGELAKECDYSKSHNFSNAKNFYLYGNKDFFIDESKVQALKKVFLDKKLNLYIFTYQGKHKIDKEALTFIIKTNS